MNPHEDQDDALGVTWEGDYRIGRTKVGEQTVSTVNLGATNAARHEVWETLVFGGPFHMDGERYFTEADAIAGHERWVTALGGGRKP